MIRASVSLVDSRDAMELEIRGDVVVCHGRSWAQRSSFFIPREALSVHPAQRRDGRILLRGLLAPVAVVLGAVLAYGVGLVLQRMGAHVHTLRIADWISVAMVAASAPAFLYTAYCALRFARPRTTLRIDVHTDDEVFSIEFWRTPGQDAGLDELAQRLTEMAGAENTELRPRASYAWEHHRPLRVMLLRALRGTVALALLSVLARIGLRWYYAQDFDVLPGFYALFALPWIWEGGRYLLGRVLVSREPRDFQVGLRHYHREEFERAEEHFIATLRENPDHVPSLYFLVQHYAQRLDFDAAFRCCHHLFTLAPEIAEPLQDDLWALRRLAARMGS